MNFRNLSSPFLSIHDYNSISIDPKQPKTQQISNSSQYGSRRLAGQLPLPDCS